METNKRQRITKWLNIFLLIINISAIATILLWGRSEPAMTQPDHFSSDEFLRDQLNLSDEQYKEISELDAKIFRVYQNIIDMQCELQFKILDELMNDQPNMEYMDSLAVIIGRLQTGIKRQTIKHFTNIRGIVDKEQEELLDQLLVDMMEMNNLCQFCNKENCDRRDQIRNEQK